MQASILESDVRASLFHKIQTRTAQIFILGLGYVGLPLAIQFAKSGFSVMGLDVDETKIAKLKAGTSYIQDVDATEVQHLIKTQRLRASGDFNQLKRADVIIICVPTPLDKSKQPDISFILSAAEHIQAGLRPGQLIILESTTYPGTTDEVLLPMFTKKGLRLDQAFFLAYSPERVDPGNLTYRTESIPKLVGGVSADSTTLAIELYRSIVSEVHPVSSARTAEMAKLLENTFRSVNIALVNEMAKMCRPLGINVWEVVEAAGTKPFGFMKFYPGPGIGGHCIPLDPHYLVWKARVHGYTPRLIELAEEINTSMPDYVLDLVVEALNSQYKCVNGANIFILGAAYKPDIDDYRESPALKLIQKLHRRGAKLRYSDPYIPVLPFWIDRESYLLHSQPINEQILHSADCVLVMTDHTAFDWPMIAQHSRLTVDTRNALARYHPTHPIFSL